MNSYFLHYQRLISDLGCAPKTPNKAAIFAPQPEKGISECTEISKEGIASGRASPAVPERRVKFALRCVQMNGCRDPEGDLSVLREVPLRLRRIV